MLLVQNRARASEFPSGELLRLPTVTRLVTGQVNDAEASDLNPPLHVSRISLALLRLGWRGSPATFLPPNLHTILCVRPLRYPTAILVPIVRDGQGQS